MGKSVQIDLDLFFDLVDYMGKQRDLHGRDLSSKLNEKYERLLDHAYFTEYKRSPAGSSEREKFRQIYLDRMGIKKSFRSDKEIIADAPDDDNDSPDF